MSAPPRGPRGGGRGARGNSRGGRGSAPRSRSNNNNTDGHESDSSRAPSSRGRGRGNNTQSSGRGFHQAIHNATKQQSSTRGGKAPRGSNTGGFGGPRPATPSSGALFGGVGAVNKETGETPEQRFQRERDEREANRYSGGATFPDGYGPGSSLGLLNARGMVGTCQDMCSPYERARRIFQRDVWGPEKVCLCHVMNDCEYG